MFKRLAPFIHRSGRAGFKCRLRARELKARARGGGSEHLVRTILYLQGWLIGARARRRERDAAFGFYSSYVALYRWSAQSGIICYLPTRAVTRG